ncbi:hypothetical protein HDU98_006033, partial [Podochytrium sp. JEL0797]
NAHSQYMFSTLIMSTADNGCLQARMDAMIPYFNACSFSVVPNSFFGFNSGNMKMEAMHVIQTDILPPGSNYYYSPADFQWYCYTTYGILLTGKGLPAVPPTVE